MNFSKDELKLMTVLAVNGPRGEPVIISNLEEFFDRRCKLRGAVRSLERWGIITHDPFKGVARLLVQPMLRALACSPTATQPVLFQDERPLDAPLAAVQSHVSITSEQPGDSSVQARPPDAGCVTEHAPRVQSHKTAFAPIPKPPEPEPPEPPGNPSLCYDSLSNSLSNSLRNDDVSRHLKELKEDHKGIKPLMNFVSLSAALLEIESVDELTAYKAMCGILGGEVMEGGDTDPRTGQIRFGDGGKWRNRWRKNRRKVHKVLAELISEIKESKIIKSRGGRSEFFWNEFYGTNSGGVSVQKEIKAPI